MCHTRRRRDELGMAFQLRQEGFDPVLVSRPRGARLPFTSGGQATESNCTNQFR